MPLAPSEFYLAYLSDLHQLLLASPIVRTHLNGTAIRLDGKNLTLEDFLEFPFGTLSTLEFAHLFSVFDGSRVHQQYAYQPQQDTPPGIYFTVINHHVLQSPYKNRLGIYSQSCGKADLYIDSLHIGHYFLKQHQTPPMLGTVAFALCAITAHLLGLSCVSLTAAGGVGFEARYIGYKVWPKLGFDAAIEPEEIACFPHLANCCTVQQVLAIDDYWWERYGSQRLMTFDLSAHSASWLKLLRYLHRKLANWGHS